MRRLAVAWSVALVASATPVFAQQAGQAPAPAAPPVTSQAPAPAPQTPAPPPAAAAQPRPPFPDGARIAFVNLQQVAALSGEGKLAAAKVQALIQRKQAEAATRQKALAENQNKLQQSGALLSDAARTQLEREIERQNVEGQRFQQDAQTEINDMNQQLQAEFEQKLRPVLDELAREKKLYLLLSAADAGLVWADPALDLTLDVVQRLDARSAPAPAPAAAPAAAPRP